MSELEARNEQLDAFAHTVAHDLKGPLATMIGYTDMVRTYLHDLSPDEVRSHLASVLRTGDQMNRIVDSLLLLARVYRLEDVELDRLDMGMVVQHALDRVRTMVISQGAEIVMPDDAWPWVVGYAPWLEQVWVNYLTNGIKYGGTPPTLTLGFEYLPLDGETGVYRFWVRDNGAGLSEEEVDKLFVPLTRLEPDRAEGHGLGLTIVQRIVDKLGGRVGVAAQKGEGSTFWFALPVYDWEEE
jgi:signal transduction histidine kinase